MTNDNREAFLNNLATKLKTPRHTLKDHPFVPLNDLPHETLANQTQDELLDLAIKSSQNVKVPVVITNTEQLGQALNDQIALHDQGNILLPTSEAFKDLKLEDWQTQLSQKQQVDYWLPDGDRETNLKKAEQANVAISFADFLLAESGTITIATTPGQGRAFHFLPTHYISVVKKSHIVPRSTQASEFYDAEIQSGRLSTSNINFITGPSNSGDIEMIIVVGVHGPLDVTYVVVDDA